MNYQPPPDEDRSLLVLVSYADVDPSEAASRKKCQGAPFSFTSLIPVSSCSTLRPYPSVLALLVGELTRNPVSIIACNVRAVTTAATITNTLMVSLPRVPPPVVDPLRVR